MLQSSKIFSKTSERTRLRNVFDAVEQIRLLLLWATHKCNFAAENLAHQYETCRHCKKHPASCICIAIRLSDMFVAFFTISAAVILVLKLSVEI